MKIFAGHTKGCGFTYLSEVGPRKYVLEGQDYTAKLDDSVIDHKKSRAAESLADRIAWILSFLNYTITDEEVNLPAEDCDKADFHGMTVREALEAEADEHRLSLYVDFEKVLHMFRTETVTAPFELNDLDPDYATSFPYTEWQHTQDSVELTNAVYVQGEKRVGFRTDGTSISTYGRQERSLQDEQVRTQRQLERAGDRALAENKDPQIDGTAVVWEPGLRAGMTFALTNAEWGSRVNGNYIVISAAMEAVDPHDTNGTAYLKTTIQYSDRRRAKPNKARPGKPENPEIIEGAEIETHRWCYSQAMNRLQLTGAFRYGELGDEYDFAGPDGPIHHEVTQQSHVHNVPWTSGLCELGLGAQTGDLVEEQWFQMDLGDLEGIVGVKVAFSIEEIKGVAAQSMFDIGTATEIPQFVGDERKYELAGRRAVVEDTFEFMIPRALLKANETNYVVIGASWRCFRAGNACTNDIAGLTDTVTNGLFGSGSFQVEDFTAHEMVYDGTGQTGWLSGDGEVDGINDVYQLIDWNGKGIPAARLGAIILSYPQDYDFDDEAGTVTFATPPSEGTNVAFRYKS